MSDGYRSFDGDAWVGRDVALEGGPYRILAETVFEVADEMAFIRTGRKAQVYKLLGPDGALHALKVFYHAYRLAEYTRISRLLRPFGHLDGLRVCLRRVVGGGEAEAVGEPGLAGAVLMPWIEGMAWVGVVERRHPLTEETGLVLAGRTVRVLAQLETEGLAHADISSSNVIVTNDHNGPSIELIDVEDMYDDSFGPVPHVPDGSPGYAHPGNQGQGCRNRYGDRFAAAILLTEMLTWHDPTVRESTADTSLFDQSELGVRGSKYDLVRKVLEDRSADVAALFTRAWNSSGLPDCPPLAEWAEAVGTMDTERAPGETLADIDDLIPHAASPRAAIARYRRLHPNAAPPPNPSKSSFPGVPTHDAIGFIPLFDADDAV